jgi:hypothetical protein
VTSMDQLNCPQALRMWMYAAMKSVKTAATVAILVVVGLARSQPIMLPQPGRVSADDCSAARKEIEETRTATWTTSFYVQCQSEAHTKNRWFRDKDNNQRYAYKAPGLYRNESVGEDGTVAFVSIENLARRCRLDVNYMDKSATLTALEIFPSMYSPDGPFAKYLELLKRKDLRSLTKKKVAGRDAKEVVQHVVDPRPCNPIPIGRMRICGRNAKLLGV